MGRAPGSYDHSEGLTLDPRAKGWRDCAGEESTIWPLALSQDVVGRADSHGDPPQDARRGLHFHQEMQVAWLNSRTAYCNSEGRAVAGTN